MFRTPNNRTTSVTRVPSAAVTAMGILAVIGVLAWISAPRTTNGSAASTGPAAFTIPVRAYDFGRVSMAAGRVTRQFEITNTSDRTIRVNRLSTSCMCTTATITSGTVRRGPFGMEGHGGRVPKIDVPVAPGARTTIDVTFDPAAHGPAGVGAIERTIQLETDAGEEQFTIRAVVTP